MKKCILSKNEVRELIFNEVNSYVGRRFNVEEMNENIENEFGESNLKIKNILICSNNELYIIVKCNEELLLMNNYNNKVINIYTFM